MIHEGDSYKIDTYKVKQYEEKRVVDTVTVVDTPQSRAKLVLVHSPYLGSDVLVPRSELVPILSAREIENLL